MTAPLAAVPDLPRCWVCGRDLTWSPVDHGYICLNHDDDDKGDGQ